MLRRRTLVLFLLTLLPIALVASQPTAEGARLSAFLDSLQVGDLWVAGTHVNWRSGQPDAGNASGRGKKSHCSAFVASACERLGVYILRPPEHGQVLLANAQYDWLRGPGREDGWWAVDSGGEAQELANQGKIVVAVYRSSDRKKAGHIAIVRPGTKSDELLTEEGPDVIQAGQENYLSTSLKNGFRHHRGAWEGRNIRFYAHSRKGQ